MLPSHPPLRGHSTQSSEGICSLPSSPCPHPLNFCTLSILLVPKLVPIRSLSIETHSFVHPAPPNCPGHLFLTCKVEGGGRRVPRGDPGGRGSQSFLAVVRQGVLQAIRGLVPGRPGLPYTGGRARLSA